MFFLAPKPRVAGPAKTKTFISTLTISGSVNPATYSSYNFGSAAAGTLIIVAAEASGASGVTLTGITIGGNAMTLIVGAAVSQHRSAIYAYRVPAGATLTTANIVVTYSGSVPRNSIAVWKVTNVDDITPTATATSTADPATATLPVADKGVAFGFAGVSDTGSATWSGLTEDSDVNYDSANGHSSGGSAATTGDGSLSISCDRTSADARRTAVFASFA